MPNIKDRYTIIPATEMEPMLTPEHMEEKFYYSRHTGQLFRRLADGTLKECKKISYGYYQIGITYQGYFAWMRVHRICFYMCNKFWPLIVDHKNGNSLDNRPENLQASTASLNSRNRNKPVGSVPVVGVYCVRSRQMYRATITYNKKQLFLGEFTNLYDAVMARFKAEIHYRYPNMLVSTAATWLKERGFKYA